MNMQYRTISTVKHPSKNLHSYPYFHKRYRFTLVSSHNRSTYNYQNTKKDPRQYWEWNYRWKCIQSLIYMKCILRQVVRNTLTTYTSFLCWKSYYGLRPTCSSIDKKSVIHLCAIFCLRMLMGKIYVKVKINGQIKVLLAQTSDYIHTLCAILIKLHVIYVICCLFIPNKIFLWNYEIKTEIHIYIYRLI